MTHDAKKELLRRMEYGGDLVTDDTTIRQLERWLRDHGATLTFRLGLQYPTTLRAPIAVELSQAVYEFEKKRAPR